MGGEVLLLILWFEIRRVGLSSARSMLGILFASLPCPLGFLGGPWVQVHGGLITADVAAWPRSASPLCKFSSVLG